MEPEAKKPNSQRTLYQTLTLIGIVLLIVYALVQPRLNRQFGWNLPGLPGDKQDAKQADSELQPNSKIDPLEEQNRTKKQNDASTQRTANDSKSDSARDKADLEQHSKASQSDNEAELGKLQEIRPKVFESTAGLIYTPGSQEGHRIKHVLAHAQDEPNRDGPHGVFDDKEKVFAILDEAYVLIKEHSSQVSENDEGDRTVYEVNLKRRIGYVGGSTGRRMGNPSANYVRMVLEDREVITAFPVRK
jgi:hypothetical protein